MTKIPAHHILEDVTRPRDPDARQEAISHCGVFEECSGSGKHSMVFNPDNSDCDKCKELYAKEQEYFRKTGGYDV